MRHAELLIYWLIAFAVLLIVSAVSQIAIHEVIIVLSQQYGRLVRHSDYRSGPRISALWDNPHDGVLPATPEPWWQRLSLRLLDKAIQRLAREYDQLDGDAKR